MNHSLLSGSRALGFSDMLRIARLLLAPRFPDAAALAIFARLFSWRPLVVVEVEKTCVAVSRVRPFLSQPGLIAALRWAARRGVAGGIGFRGAKEVCHVDDALAAASFAFWKLDDEEIFELANWMASKGMGRLLEMLLPRIDEKDHFCVMDAAAESGRSDIVAKMMPTSRTDNAVGAAIERGFEDIVDMLIVFEPEEERSWMLRKAATNGHLGLTKRFAPHPSISRQDLSNIIVAAASSGHLDVVKYLCSKTDDVPTKAFGQSISKGHFDVASFLLTRIPPVDGGNYIFGDDASVEARLQFLLNFTTISVDTRRRPIQVFCRRGRLDLIKLLFIPGVEVDLAFAIAATNAHLDVIEFFFEHLSPGFVDYLKALEWNRDVRQEDLARFLRVNVCEPPVPVEVLLPDYEDKRLEPVVHVAIRRCLSGKN